MADHLHKGPKRNIIIFTSSTRPDRMGERVGLFVKESAENCNLNAEIFDPMLMKFELLRVPFHFMDNPESAPAWMKEADRKIREADGFIIVSGEYNSFIPPALTNMMDHFSPASYRHRPVGYVTYSVGGYGGIRTQAVLPPFTIELGMVTIPTAVYIPTVQNHFTADGKCKDEKISSKIAKMIQELHWYAEAIFNQKTILSPP